MLVKLTPVQLVTPEVNGGRVRQDGDGVIGYRAVGRHLKLPRVPL